MLAILFFLIYLKAMKEGKFLFEATVNISNKCALSDPNGGLAEHWTEQWTVAVLKKHPEIYLNLALIPN